MLVAIIFMMVLPSCAFADSASDYSKHHEKDLLRMLHQMPIRIILPCGAMLYCQYKYVHHVLVAQSFLLNLRHLMPILSH